MLGFEAKVDLDEGLEDDTVVLGEEPRCPGVTGFPGAGSEPRLGARSRAWPGGSGRSALRAGRRASSGDRGLPGAGAGLNFPELGKDGWRRYRGVLESGALTMSRRWRSWRARRGGLRGRGAPSHLERHGSPCAWPCSRSGSGRATRWIVPAYTFPQRPTASSAWPERRPCSRTSIRRRSISFITKVYNAVAPRTKAVLAVRSSADRSTRRRADAVARPRSCCSRTRPARWARSGAGCRCGGLGAALPLPSTRARSSQERRGRSWYHDDERRPARPRSAGCATTGSTHRRRSSSRGRRLPAGRHPLRGRIRGCTECSTS